MKRSTKPAVLCLFALFFSGCLPQERLTGRVIDLTGPVPEAAVLGMVWVEDGDKAGPAPDVKGLKSEEIDAAMDKDMQDRGLPAAYARTFAGKDGWFTLDNFHFSAGTKKAVKAMEQPRITRVTMWAFQRGYRKQAVTVFPQSTTSELPPATVILSRPESWKQLALDSSYRTLRQDVYDAGYSKEFGATKEEKAWFLEYTNSNLDKAYAESNIKGDKVWEEDCGHDYNDVIISTAGMQRNPAREKCNRLLHQMGVLREWKEEWLGHSQAISGRTEPHISAVKEALGALGPEYAEVKANEGYIIAGVDEAENEQRKSRTNQNLRNGLNENKTGTEEAQRLYNTGDKAGAYKALGGVLYSQLPEEVRQGPLTAQLLIKTTPGITDTAAGFYLLMNRPLTAQLPNGDNGNHKDKPGYKAEGSTGTADKGSAVNKSISTNGGTTPKTIKLGDDDIDVEIGGDKIKRSALYRGSDGVVLESREVKDKDAEGQPEDKFIERRAFGSPGADYILRSHSVLGGYGGFDNENVGSFEKSVFELFDKKGNKLFEKELGNRKVEQTWIFKNGTSVLYTNESRDLGENIFRYQVYDSSGNPLNEITSTAGMIDDTIERYKIINGINISQFIMSPQADAGLFAAAVGDVLAERLPGAVRKIIKLDMNGKLSEIGSSETGYMILIFLKEPGIFLAFTTMDIDKLAPSGRKYRLQTIHSYKNFKLIWKTSIEAESFGMSVRNFSKTGKYIIVEHWKDVVMDDNGIKYKENVKILNSADGRIVYDGDKSSEKAKKYTEELITE